MKKLNSVILGTATAAALFCACTTQPAAQSSDLTASGLNPADYDTVYAGAVYADEKYTPADSLEAKEVKLYQLKNANGMEVCITNFAGRIVSIVVPDKDGNMQDVVLGMQKAADYFPFNNQSDMGSAIGRYANRIDQGIIKVDDKEIQLPKNNFGHCLHGGFTGYQYQVYDVKEVTDQSITLEIVSPDGDNDFPGTLTATVKYTLTDDNAIEISYDATSDATTIVNMTNHSYFNLNGDPAKPISNHVLTLNADYYTPVDSTYMTTGEVAPVAGTPMDFTKPTEIGKDLKNFDFEQVKNGNGFDHNWVLNTKGDEKTSCAHVYSPLTGIALDVYTNEPGIQFYSGNFLDGTITGKKGIVYNQHAGLCLETQKFPDSPNKYQMKGWELCNPYLKAGEKYHSYCKFAFSIQK